MKKRRLRKSETKELSNKLNQLYAVSFDKKEELEEVIIGNTKVILKGKEPFFFFYNETPVPTLKKCIEDHNLLKKIVVDMGAVKFVTSGADIMRPGITEVDENIRESEVVMVVDENNKKPLAITSALYPGHEIKGMQKGKVLENLHYVGDDIWNAEK